MCTRANTHLLFSPRPPLPLYCEDALGFPSLSACCLLIRRTICWSCVFSSARRPLGTQLCVAVLYQLSNARGAPSTIRCPLHRHEVCVLTPGSLSACHRIMGRESGSPLFNSPYHSFGELVNSSLRRAVIYGISWSISKLLLFLYISVQTQSTLAAVFVLRNNHCPLFLCSVPWQHNTFGVASSHSHPLQVHCASLASVILHEGKCCRMEWKRNYQTRLRSQDTTMKVFSN